MAKTKGIPMFLALAYVSAFIFEEMPRIILNHINVWEGPFAIPIFFVWYGVLFIVAYFLFVQKPFKYAVVFGIIVGMLAETFIFRKMNIFTFFMFPILYGLMFYLPFKVLKVIRYNDNFAKKEILLCFALISFVILVLFMLRFVILGLG